MHLTLRQVGRQLWYQHDSPDSSQRNTSNARWAWNLEKYPQDARHALQTNHSLPELHTM